MKNKFPKLLAIIVSFFGIVVMVGWIFDIQVLKSILPQFVTMKFTTALSFVFSGIILYGVSRKNEVKNEITDIILLFVSFGIFLLMATLLIAVFLGIKTGIEDLFVREAPGAINTVVPGRPALITMVNFILIASFGFLSFLDKKIFIVFLEIFSLVVLLFGILSIVGYMTDIPVLYGQINEISTAVAFHTAVLFVFLGVGFFSEFLNLRRKI